MIRAVAWTEYRSKMPLARYFLFVGGALLALLFAVNAALPSIPVSDKADTVAELPAIRIHSDRKWPERVVFDTRLPTIVPAQIASNEVAKNEVAKNEPSVPAPVAVPTASSEFTAKAHVREAFAQFPPSQPTKAEPKPQRKPKIAKRHLAPPMMLVAQQPQFGFNANRIW